jgi:hypothetical protein
MYYREVHYHSHGHNAMHALGLLMRAMLAAAGGVVVLLLTTRFILSLLQVDRLLNPVASFIYNISYPFVAPFFALFNFRQPVGGEVFEYQTVLAIAFWALAAWLLTKLFNFGTTE